jgi:hypothetical protein
MTALDTTAGSRAGAIDVSEGIALRSRAWDRIFIAGGAFLVPVPILAFYLFRGLGASVAASEDLVTLLVMVPLGGPHVFATYTRTLLNPRFAREDRILFVAMLALIVLVAGTAVASAFFDVLLHGSPPIRYLLTFFFFWAGIHIVQQNSYVAACYGDLAAQRAAPSRSRRWWGLVDYAVMLLALYPVSLFRMSMVNLADPSMATADPGALATRIVAALSSPEFADQYVFRIGRVAPVLPGFMTAPAFWIGITVLFAASLLLFAIKTAREKRQRTLVKVRFQLVFWMAVLGFLVPLFPNLDSAFQGMNAWHSFQYLGLLWLMNRNSQERGEIKNRFFDGFMGEGRHWRFYLTALGGTLGLLLLVFTAGAAIQFFSGGEFALFGHEHPRLDPETGRELYRPGAVLLAYYMIAFGLLLVHYLHDGVFFFRKRYVLRGAK